MLRKKVGSPLTDHLGPSFGGQKQKRKRIVIGAALLLIVPYLGSTLAASVTISGAGGTTAIEFGQGSQVAITCDTTISTELNESWYATDTSFRVDTIVLSNLNITTASTATTNDLGCGGKSMTVSLFTGTGASATAAIIGSANATSVTFQVPTSNGAFTPAGSTQITGSATISAPNATITLTLPTSINLDASTITRVSIETD